MQHSRVKVRIEIASGSALILPGNARNHTIEDFAPRLETVAHSLVKWQAALTDMPESRESVSQESRLSQESMDLPMDYNDDFDVDPENAEDGLVESSLNRSRDSAKSIESLNTLLMRMPEIHIPTLVHNPLPLQCLAASALPPELRREIDGVIAEYVCDEELLDVCAAEEVQHQQEPAAPANAMLESATAMAGDNGTKETVEQVDSAQQVRAWSTEKSLQIIIFKEPCNMHVFI